MAAIGTHRKPRGPFLRFKRMDQIQTQMNQAKAAAWHIVRAVKVSPNRPEYGAHVQR